MPLYRELQRKTQQLRYNAKASYMVAIGNTTKIATCFGVESSKKRFVQNIVVNKKISFHVVTLQIERNICHWHKGILR